MTGCNFKFSNLSFATLRGLPRLPFVGNEIVWPPFRFGHCKCESRCCFNLSCLANIRGQILQAKGLSPVCTLLCLAKCDALVKARVQRSQEKGLCCALSDLLSVLVSLPSFPPALFMISNFLFTPTFGGSFEFFKVSYKSTKKIILKARAIMNRKYIIIIHSWAVTLSISNECNTLKSIN